MTSRFLPKDFHPTSEVCLIAGRGSYPFLSAAEMQRLKIPIHLVCLEGETSPELFPSFNFLSHQQIKVGQMGRMLRAVRDSGARHVLMVGQIRPGKLFRGMHPDLKAIRILSSLRERNAHTIFRAVVSEIEGIGAQVLDARAFLDEHLASEGPMVGKMSGREMEEIKIGIHKTKQVSALDIGQGLVMSGGTVLAVEGFDGTDAMLERCKAFSTREKLFIKVAKPEHDFRFDVPVFGERTIDSLKSGGINKVALEADRTLLLDKPRILRLAKKNGIRMVGFCPSGC